MRKKTLPLALSLLLACLFSLRPALAQDFLVVRVDDKIIGPVTAEYLTHAIEKAEKEGLEAVIIEMDTPGGLLESTRAIVKKIVNAEVPIITFVSPSGSRAGSAGVFIVLASHIAAMAPTTNIGAAHPVVLGENRKNENALKKAIEELTRTLRKEAFKKPKTQKSEGAPTDAGPNQRTADTPSEEKILNDTVAWITAIANNRNRNAEWARAAVLESVSATEKEALEKKIIDVIAVDIDELLAKIDGLRIALPHKTVVLDTKNARLLMHEMTLRQNILNTIIAPNIAYILMMAGVLGIFIEIIHPGALFPGIAGIISLIIAFYAFAALPVNYAGVLLIAIGVILFVAETLTPLTFGLLALGGGVSILVGSLMLIDSPFAALQVSLHVILPFILAALGIALFLALRVLRAHRQKTSTGPESLIGATGTAQADFDGPEGQVFVRGELWTAVAEKNQSLKKGNKIKVNGVDNVKLIVSKYDV